jgi:hypothetical protein
MGTFEHGAAEPNHHSATELTANSLFYFTLQYTTSTSPLGLHAESWHNGTSVKALLQGGQTRYYV